MAQAYVGEFAGTLLLVLLGNGAVSNVVLPRTKGHNGGWIVITAGYAMAVFVAVWCVAPLSGAHINPAVTLGLAMAGQFAWEEVPGYMLAQLAGAFAGGALVFEFYRDHFAAGEDPDAKLAAFATVPAIRRPLRNLFCETIATLVLVLAVLCVVEPTIAFETPNEGITDAPSARVGLGTLGALPVGLLVFSIGLSLGGTTGYAINPARDLGPRLAHAVLPVPAKRDSDWGYAWVPVVGPLVGGALAAGVHRLLV